jgi:hypothetical protein
LLLALLLLLVSLLLLASKLWQAILLLLEMEAEPFPLQSIHDILSDLVTQLFNLFESLSVNCGP